MIETNDKQEAPGLELECKLDASPEKVWRAITIPAFRDCWLPEGDLADTQPVSSEEGRKICYRMREDTPPFLESTVTFQVEPDANGGTILRIIHELTDAQLSSQIPPAANCNKPLLMRAA